MVNILIIPFICVSIIILSSLFLEFIDRVSDLYIEKINKKEEN